MYECAWIHVFLFAISFLFLKFNTFPVLKIERYFFFLALSVSSLLLFGVYFYYYYYYYYYRYYYYYYYYQHYGKRMCAVLLYAVCMHAIFSLLRVPISTMNIIRYYYYYRIETAIALNLPLLCTHSHIYYIFSPLLFVRYEFTIGPTCSIMHTYTLKQHDDDDDDHHQHIDIEN